MGEGSGGRIDSSTFSGRGAELDSEMVVEVDASKGEMVGVDTFSSTIALISSLLTASVLAMMLFISLWLLSA